MEKLDGKIIDEVVDRIVDVDFEEVTDTVEQVMDNSLKETCELSYRNGFARGVIGGALGAGAVMVLVYGGKKYIIPGAKKLSKKIISKFKKNDEYQDVDFEEVTDDEQ